MPDIKYQNFTLKESWFEHHSSTHGINHTYRVMFHVLNIGKKAKLDREIKPAWCAAFIHDMARVHDGYCTEHGLWSAETKLPLFKDFFLKEGIKEEELEAIKLAVANHSTMEELPKNHAFYKIAALLKDADALDRFRISETNLKVKYLRFPESVELVDFANQLYLETADMEITSFDALLKIARRIEAER